MNLDSRTAEPFESQVRDVLARVASDLGLLVDRPVEILSTSTARCRTKPVCNKQVHIAFKLLFEWRGQTLYGSLLVPLPEAVSLACLLLVLPVEALTAKRASNELDQPTKDALLEIGNFIGGAIDGALRLKFPQGLSVRSLGCQGLRPEQPPAFPHKPADEWIAGRAQARIGQYPAFELLLILPVLVAESVPSI